MPELNNLRTGRERVETHRSLRVLFVDDERSLQEFMRSELPRLGHEVTVCPDGKAGIKALEKGTFDVAILDLRMPGMTGIEVLAHLKQVAPDTEAIVMTGHASQETAIEALRLGAFDYLTKPCRLTEIEVILAKVAEKRDLKHKNIALENRVQAAEGPTVLVGASPAMAAVHRLIATVAPTDSTVLILGETGTGKELAARTLWLQSKRTEMPFVPVNCGALSENLVESELFGHVKGAFTGADRDHKGLFEVARRSRRAEQDHPGEAPALPGVGRDPPGRRHETVQDRRARALRHQPRPADDDQGRPVPRGPLLPHQHL